MSDAIEVPLPDVPWPGCGSVQMDALFLETYQELRRLARAKLRQNESITLLDTTVLVHESYLRFQKMGQVDIRDRGQFLGYAARIMRFVVIDSIRQRRAQRRGGDAVHVTLAAEVLEELHDADEDCVLRVHEALQDLAEVDPRLVQIVEMRYFADLDEKTIAAALGVTDRTVRREWKKARLILKAALQ
jgi:RNA polymerase sigma factor (TIGR02999 family)